MPTFHLAWRAVAGDGSAELTALLAGGETRLTPPVALALAAPTRLAVRAGVPSLAVLTGQVDPATGTITIAAERETLHYLRLADGTVQPQPPAPPPWLCAAGDAYLAVTPGAARLAGGQLGGASTAIARFLHLRDYFNADKLAEAMLAHLLEMGEDAASAGVLVVEAR